MGTTVISGTAAEPPSTPETLNWWAFSVGGHNRRHGIDGPAMHDGRTAIHRRDFLRRHEISRPAFLGQTPHVPAICRGLELACRPQAVSARLPTVSGPDSAARWSLAAGRSAPSPSRSSAGGRDGAHLGLELSRKPSPRLHGGSSSSMNLP